MALLSGKVAIVTGGGRGLGRCHALALAAHGACVVVNDLGGSVTGGSPDQKQGGAADEVVAEIIAMSGQAVANRASVADWAGAESIIADAVAAFGGLDIVVNNAGINRPASLIDLTEADYDLETNVHLKGTTAVCHHAARLWAREGRKDGRAIVNTTSPVGVHPMINGGPYCAAKAGIAALTVVAAQELASLGVRANAIAPAARTRMVMASPTVDELMPRAEGFDRHLPDHVSPLVVYLASPLNRFTGRIFGVEGPDVALYQPWSADWLASGDGHWEVPALADALAALPEQAPIRAFYPGGRIDTVIPPNRTLKALRGVTPIVSVFAASPDRGRGLARDMAVRWALAEVEQSHELRPLSFAELKTQEHKARQPFGQIPTYESDSLTLFESGAIVLHIAETHPGLLPSDPAARARTIAWMFAAVSTIEPVIVEREVAVLLEGDKPWTAERLPMLEARLRQRLDDLAAWLVGKDWLEGDFSAGDIMMVCVLRRPAAMLLMGDYPVLAAYVARAEARTAFQTAFAEQKARFDSLTG